MDFRNDSQDSSDAGKHGKKSNDSDQTVLSYSPPLEILVASTIEHHEKGHDNTLPRGGMLPPETQLAHFVVTKYIGGGGMGRVYLGVDQALDRKVALKVLPTQRAHDSASVARFMNEAKSAARLNHEHIAQVYFAGEHNGIPFIAFEYVQGTNLRTFVEEHGVLSLSHAINYLLQISHALAHAATHQVIHRDVKPSNILITPNGRAKLIDMGLARLLTHANVDNDLTASGVTLGTFDYISPEQARDPRNADSRSDIYSLGCTFFFMLAGRPPFSEGTVLQKLLQHQGDDPPDVRDYQPNIPLQVSQIIQKMMAKEPRARYQSASELVDDLTEVAKMIGLRPVGTGSLIWQLPLKWRFQPVLRHLPWCVPLILFGLIALLLLNGIFFGPTQEPALPVPVVPSDTSFLDTHTSDTTNQPTHRTPNEPNSRNGNGGTNPPVDTLPPQWHVHHRNVNSVPLPSQETNNSRITAAIPFQSIGSALEVEPSSASVPITPGLAASYQMSSPQTQKNGGLSIPISENLSLKKLIVDPSGRQPNTFKTLRDAARAAAREATIELHFNGPVDIEYFRFSELKTTIKSGEGYRAKIAFRPTASVGLTGTYSMATLDNSKMVFENVEIEVVIPPEIDPSNDRWTMFDMIGKNTVELRNVILTFNNTQRERANQEKNAFFRCCPISPATPVLSPATSWGTPSPVSSQTSLTLENCLIRGEASLLRCDNSRAVKVDSNNVLIAINQPVFSLLDIRPYGTMNNLITANFRHNTIYAPFIVSWQQGTPGGTLGHPIELSLDDSIVRFHGESTGMAEYAGDLAELSDIKGFYSRNSSRSFYQNFINEWIIRQMHPGRSSPKPPDESFLLQQRFFNTVVWENTYTDSIDYIPVHELTKSHFRLNKNSSLNNALNTSLEGADAGMIPERIQDPDQPFSYFP